jgi:site-specific recombinase XerD
MTIPPSGRSRRRPAEPLTTDEVLALMKACSQRAPTRIRNRALVAVLRRSGLRISELRRWLQGGRLSS